MREAKGLADYRPQWCTVSLVARMESMEVATLLACGRTDGRAVAGRLDGPLEELLDFLWLTAEEPAGGGRLAGPVPAVGRVLQGLPVLTGQGWEWPS